MVSIKPFVYDSETGTPLKSGKYSIPIEVLNDTGVFVTSGSVHLGIDSRVVGGLDPNITRQEVMAHIQEPEVVENKTEEIKPETEGGI